MAAATGSARAARASTLLGQQTLFAHFDQSGDEERSLLGRWLERLFRRRAHGSSISSRERKIANPVILSGDIHAFVVNDIHAAPEDLASPIVATELVTTSITSTVAAAERRSIAGCPENPERAPRAQRRARLPAAAVDAERLHADLVAVDDVTRADSGTHVIASFDVLDGVAASCAESASFRRRRRCRRRASARCESRATPDAGASAVVAPRRARGVISPAQESARHREANDVEGIIPFPTTSRTLDNGLTVIADADAERRPRRLLVDRAHRVARRVRAGPLRLRALLRAHDVSRHEALSGGSVPAESRGRWARTRTRTPPTITRRITSR